MSSSTNLVDEVKRTYRQSAQSNLSSRDAGVHAVAEAFGYSAGELASIPAEANLGLSCGNPIAIASLRPGEVVVDLGSGGGLDVFLASEKVGPTGRAIGIDMTPEMIARAQRNAQKGPAGKPYTNVEFHLSTIDRLPLPDASVDCVISNCVINLAPDKRAVFKEIARVLKPGGRLAVSDIALKRELPEKLKASVAAYTGCIAGAIPASDYVAGLKEAGLTEVQVIDTNADLNAYAKVENQSACCTPAPAPSSCCGSSKSVRLAEQKVDSGSSCCVGDDKPLHEQLGALLREFDVNDYAASVKVFAVKPVG
jgi:SAM-dependent methyltransferase